MLVYILAFDYIIGSPIENFALYLISGLFPWTFFASSLQESTGSIRQSGPLIENINFPREIVPLADLLFNFVEYLLTMGVFLSIAFLILDAKIAISLLVFPLLLILQFLFMFGVALFLSAMTVYFRDLEHIVEVLIQPIFWLTPIIYNVGMIPDRLQPFLNLNPFAAFIMAYHDVFYRTAIPGRLDFLAITIWTVISLTVGLFVFRRYEPHFAETI
jgi:ABC-2 type transport system permease protein